MWAMARWPLLLSALFGVAVCATPEQRAELVQSLDEQHETLKSSDRNIYVVRLSEVGVSNYLGTHPKYPAPRRLANQKLDKTDANYKKYMVFLQSQQQAAVKNMRDILQLEPEVIHTYFATFNGLAVRLNPSLAVKLTKEMHNLHHIELDQVLHVAATQAPSFIGAGAVWDGTSGLSATKGEGIIIGVVDDGIDFNSPSFAARGGDGYMHTNPLGSGKYLGSCDVGNQGTRGMAQGRTREMVGAYNSSVKCNSKLIGMWAFSASGNYPMDSRAYHGTATAGAAGGNFVMGNVSTPTGRMLNNISGVAPHANIISYKVCDSRGECRSSSVAAASDQAVHDGVDILCMAFTLHTPRGRFDKLYQAQDSMTLLALRDAGIFVAVPAGNRGPSKDSISRFAELPFVTSVGAVSNNRVLAVNITLHNPMNLTQVNRSIMGLGVNGKHLKMAMLVLAKDLPAQNNISGHPRLCQPGSFRNNTFHGEIVVCERGMMNPIDIGRSVMSAGAHGLVIAQPNSTDGFSTLRSDMHALPALHIDFLAYTQLKDFFSRSAGNATATISMSYPFRAPSMGNIIANFSSQGPNSHFGTSSLSPKVLAVGAGQFFAPGAPVNGRPSFSLMEGSSLATAQVCGAAALVKAARSSWTVAEIESSLMMSSVPVMKNATRLATPLEGGAGRIDVARAVRMGFVLDITSDKFVGADPADGGMLRDLNQASFGGKCLLNSPCTWTRTIKASMITETVTYIANASGEPGFNVTISPSSFSLASEGTQVITVTATVFSGSAMYRFGKVNIFPVGKPYTDAHFPVVVEPTMSSLKPIYLIPAQRGDGKWVQKDLRFSANISHLTTKMISGRAMLHSIRLRANEEHRFPSFMVNRSVALLSIEVSQSQSSNIAVFLSFLPANMSMNMSTNMSMNRNTNMSSQRHICRQFEGMMWQRSCTVHAPEPGTYFASIVNQNRMAQMPEDVTVAIAILVNSSMGPRGPLSHSLSIPVNTTKPEISIGWSEPGLMPGAVLFGLLTVHDGTTVIAHSLIKVIRQPDPAFIMFTGVPRPGATLHATITVRPNLRNHNEMLEITNSLPAGFKYVANSSRSSSGVVNFTGKHIFWSGVMKAGAFPTYRMETNQNNGSCQGKYVPLADRGMNPDPKMVSRPGRPTSWQFPPCQNPPCKHDDVFFFGHHYDMLHISDKGYLQLGPVNFAEGQGASRPQMFPNRTLPNAIIAALWADIKIVHNSSMKWGITTFVDNTTIIVEYRGVHTMSSNGPVADFQIHLQKKPMKGKPQIMFVYRNIKSSDLPNVATIGLEDMAGRHGAVVLNRGNSQSTLSNNMSVCFHYVPAATMIEFDVQLGRNILRDVPNPVTNYMLLRSNLTGSRPSSIRTMVKLQGSAMKVKGIKDDPILLTRSWISVSPDFSLMNTESPIKVDGFRVLAGKVAFKLAEDDGMTCSGTAPGSPDLGRSTPAGSRTALVGPVSDVGRYRVCFTHRNDWEPTSTVMRILNDTYCFVTVSEIPDDRPEENSWTLKKGSTQIATGGFGTRQVQIARGSYNFTMFDSMGDGMSSGTTGMFSVSVDGLKKYSTSSFGFNKTVVLQCNRGDGGKIYEGSHSCSGILSRRHKHCGCYFRRGASGNTFSLSKDVPSWAVMGHGQDSRLVNQGCCTFNTPVRSGFQLGSTEEWGLCSHDSSAKM